VRTRTPSAVHKISKWFYHDVIANQQMHIVCESILRARTHAHTVYLLHVSATHVAISREMHDKGWIHQNITEVFEPLHRYQILNFRISARFKICIKNHNTVGVLSNCRATQWPSWNELHVKCTSTNVEGCSVHCNSLQLQIWFMPTPNIGYTCTCSIVGPCITYTPDEPVLTQMNTNHLYAAVIYCNTQC
jgi:hypothetical protein